MNERQMLKAGRPPGMGGPKVDGTFRALWANTVASFGGQLSHWGSNHPALTEVSYDRG